MRRRSHHKYESEDSARRSKDMLSFGAPPSSSSATRAIAACINAFNERSDALPFGREALKRLGGIEQINEKAVNAADAFIIERFVAPTMMTLQRSVQVHHCSGRDLYDCFVQQLRVYRYDAYRIHHRNLAWGG